MQEMNNFHKFRHNDKKVDQLCTLFMANMDYIEVGAPLKRTRANKVFECVQQYSVPECLGNNEISPRRKRGKS